MRTKIKYEETFEFQKDFKKYSKKFKTLTGDLEIAKRNAIELFHIRKIDNQSVFLIPNFCSKELQICKVKKFSCRALKGRGIKSGIRVIYAFFPKILKVDFIEMYYKGDKNMEDRGRIKQYLKSL